MRRRRWRRSPPAALPKGDVLAVARLAGIMAAKRTADLIPLCHPLPLAACRRRRSTPDAASACVAIERRVRVDGAHRRRDGGAHRGRGGRRSPSTTCARRSTATMTIGAVRLVEKRGGRSGVCRRTRRALTCGAVTLKPGREAPVRAGHPWIFSGAIASGLDGAEPGEPVRVVGGRRRLRGGRVRRIRARRSRCAC